MRKPKTVPAIIALTSAAVLVMSGVALAYRIERFHEDNPRPLFYSIRTDKLAFEFEGRPVRFVPTMNDAGEGSVALKYGDPATPNSASGTSASDTLTAVTPDGGVATLEIPIEVPTSIALPGLDRFLDWMQVFLFAENAAREPLDVFREKVLSGEADLRAVVVVRRVEADPDEEPGRIAEELGVEAPLEQFREVRRDRWVFTFHELLPDGSIGTHRLRMPESGARFYRRQVRAYERGEPEPQRDADELKERTWEWDLALRTMPRPPAITKENQALLYAGWTLPVASSAALALFVSLAFAFAPDRPERWSREDESPAA